MAASFSGCSLKNRPKPGSCDRAAMCKMLEGFWHNFSRTQTDSVQVGHFLMSVTILMCISSLAHSRRTLTLKSRRCDTLESDILFFLQFQKPLFIFLSLSRRSLFLRVISIQISKGSSSRLLAMWGMKQELPVKPGNCNSNITFHIFQTGHGGIGLWTSSNSKHHCLQE